MEVIVTVGVGRGEWNVVVAVIVVEEWLRCLV